jgi:hypothetical protein
LLLQHLEQVDKNVTKIILRTLRIIKLYLMKIRYTIKEEKMKKVVLAIFAFAFAVTAFAVDKNVSKKADKNVTKKAVKKADKNVTKK